MRIGITIGDPNGIGPEVLFKCLRDDNLTARIEPVIFGSPEVMRTHATTLGYSDITIHEVSSATADLAPDGVSVVDVANGESPEVRLGSVTADGGKLAMQAVEAAVEACMAGDIEAMVTAPISKGAIAQAGFKVPGHTEFIADITETTAYTMMMVAGNLRVGLVTGHVPVMRVPELVTEAAILDNLRVVSDSLKQDFGIQRPRIAVLGLNPHAGDGGVLGQEEIDIIEPAVIAAREVGLRVEGPLPADGFFAARLDGAFDAVMAMYHDQGLAPFKALAFERGVNYTAGLPIIRTSPDHGTAYEIAGRGVARAGSMRSAIELAIDIAHFRAAGAEVTS